ncbi:MAG: hypothetical protein ACKOWC_11040 [Limnohabitans sp.]|jgi:hypothetical protein
MARWWIGLLVLLNAALLAWNIGALAPWGGAPGPSQEGPSVTLDIPTQRTSAQDAASSASAPATAPKPAASAPRPKPAATAPAAAPESN